jgi:signal transduction histidine kinase/CheY-like chemotaxis protein
LLLPTDALLAACRGPGALGLITLPLDSDGVLRRWPLMHEAAGRTLPSLPYAALLLQHAGAAPAAAREWPLARDGTALLILPRNHDATPTVAFAVLMRDALGQTDGRASRDAVAGRVVFIGSSSIVGDAATTPWGRMPGTLLLATAYGALANGRIATMAGWPVQALLLLVGALPACLTWRRGRAAALRDAAGAALAAEAIVGASVVMLAWQRIQVDALPALTVTGFGFVLAVVVQVRRTQRANRLLAEERARAESANRAKSEFLASVSHELRTPMNALLGVAELLAVTRLSSEQRRFLDTFRIAGKHLFALINDLLDLSKIEAGKAELHESVFSLRGLLADQSARLQPRLADNGLQLLVDCPADVGDWVCADAERLAQVLLNLVGNALKFTREGHVRIDVRREEALLRFSVADTGVGIAPGKLDLIFQPFVQADDNVQRTFGGTGLGLSISKKLVELMGGRIWVESTPGHGSTFHFTVRAPAREGSPAHAPLVTIDDDGPPLVRDTARVGCSILLAEDNEVNVLILEEMLKASGHVVDVAPDGEAAVLKYREGRYDLVLMDMEMPRLDGLSATRAIRRLEVTQGRPHTPIVALTAQASSEDAQRSLAAGCDAHLSKPIGQGSLLASVERFAASRGA